jgi:hypothetical protein
MGVPLAFSQLVPYLARHWLAVIIGGFVFLTIPLLANWLWISTRPMKDGTGNGISIGRPKAFDNRSLTLKMDELKKSFEEFHPAIQTTAKNLEYFQEQSSLERDFLLNVATKAYANLPIAAKEAEKSASPEKRTESIPDTKSGDFKPNLGISAGDALSDQLNLASQIVNLRTLYERSLSDRLFGAEPRLQVVLGFQISVAPPRGCENSVAIVEIAVRMQGSQEPVSLVALMPQEKTYNSAAVSSTSKSLGGSAVTRVVTLGLGARGKTQHLFLHRDSDTIAFERDPRFSAVEMPAPAATAGNPQAADQNTIFGWEFRPVLGRSTVSAGTRQMFAIVALPKPDEAAASEAVLEVVSCSYWRKYNRSSQTTGHKRGVFPWRPDRSGLISSPLMELRVPNTCKIQDSLAPKVSKIRWVAAGQDRAIILVEGKNFFPGTQIVMGNQVHEDLASGMVLKSDQALEIRTTLSALATGDAVLSGRFGSSKQLLVVPSATMPTNLSIVRAHIRPSRGKKFYRVRVYVQGHNDSGDDQDLKLDDLQQVPDPIIFLGNQPVSMPYDYFDLQALLPMRPKSSIYVDAWVPASIYAANDPIVTFQIPFCGQNLRASTPITLAEPSILRIGGDDQITVLRISQPSKFDGALQIDLDQTYNVGAPGANPPPAVLVSESEIRLALPTPVVNKYRTLVLRVTSTSTQTTQTPSTPSWETYVLSIPPEEKPQPKPVIDRTATPAQIKKSKDSTVVWSGAALDSITKVCVAGNPSPLSFDTFNKGSQLIVFVPQNFASTAGKLDFEFEIRPGEKLTASAFVSD